MLYMFLKKAFVAPLMKALYRHEVTGLQNLPQHGPAIIASNHLAFGDSIFIPLASPRQINYLAKADYFTGTGIKGKIVKSFFTGVGQIPVNREGGTKSASAVELGLSTLRDGKFLGIYPEGTRSPDGRIYRAKTGVARLALESKAPVIPVGQIGTSDVQPVGSNAVKLRKNGQKITVKTIIGEPIDLSAYYDTKDSYETLRTVSDLILSEIQKLSQQEYVDVYASSVKNLMKKEGISAEEAVQKLTKNK